MVVQNNLVIVLYFISIHLFSLPHQEWVNVVNKTMFEASLPAGIKQEADASPVHHTGQQKK